MAKLTGMFNKYIETEKRRGLIMNEENVVRYRDIASRLRKEKVMLLDTIERLNVKKS